MARPANRPLAIYEVRAISVKLGATIAARRHAPKRYFVEADQRDLGRPVPLAKNISLNPFELE